MRLLFCRGHGFMAALIRWQTWGRYSHVAIEIAGWVYEAVPFKGVRKTPAAKFNWDHVDIFVADGYHEEYTLAFLESQLGKPYDYLGVMRFLPRWKEGIFSERWFCSELFYIAVPGLLERVPAVKVSPSMLSYSPRLRKVG